MIHTSFRCWSFYNGHKSRPLAQFIGRLIGNPHRRLSNAAGRSYKVLFFGSDEFSVHSLKALHDCNSNKYIHTANYNNIIPLNSSKQQRTSSPSVLLSSSNFRSGDNNNAIQELAVVTSFKGADNAVRKFTKTTDIPMFGWPLCDPVELCSRFDVGVVVSFGHLIPEPIINAFPLYDDRTINSATTHFD